MQAFAQRSDVSILFGSAETYQQRLQVHIQFLGQGMEFFR